MRAIRPPRRIERPAATPHNPPEFQQLRDAVALMESSSKQRTRLINQLHGLLARVFPELAVHVTDLSANWVLSLLEKYSTPDQLARAKRETLAKIPHLATDMAETLRTAAAQCAVTWNPPVKALFARLRADGKEYNVCLGHCMAKLLRQVFALWTKDCNFDLHFESRPKAAVEPVSSASQYQARASERRKKGRHGLQRAKPQ